MTIKTATAIQALDNAVDLIASIHKAETDISVEDMITLLIDISVASVALKQTQAAERKPWPQYRGGNKTGWTHVQGIER